MFATYIQHLQELRSRTVKVLLSFLPFLIITWIFKGSLLHILLLPILKAGSKYTLINMHLFDQFFIYIKVVIFSSFILNTPFIWYQIYKFFSPIAQKKTKNFVAIIYLLSFFLFIFGTAVLYFFVLPHAITFFSNFSSLYVFNYISIRSYLDFILKCFFSFCIVFQFPILLIILVVTKVVKIDNLKNTKLVILINFIIASFIAPPDILSHIVIAFLLLLLYKIFLLVLIYIVDAKTFSKFHMKHKIENQ